MKSHPVCRLCGIACSVFLVAVAVGQIKTTSSDPTIAPAGQTALLELQGKGEQIYVCKLTGEVPAWTFVKPEAKLFDSSGAGVGTHGAGPAWSLRDGSSIRGTMIAQKPAAESDALPWLLLAAHDPKGTGALAAVTYIRRSDTQGGKALPTGCDALHLGAESRVPYTATYTFYIASGQTK